MELRVKMRSYRREAWNQKYRDYTRYEDIIFQLIFMCGGIGATNLRRLGFSLVHGAPFSCHSPVLLRDFWENTALLNLQAFWASQLVWLSSKRFKVRLGILLPRMVHKPTVFVIPNNGSAEGFSTVDSELQTEQVDAYSWKCPFLSNIYESIFHVSKNKWKAW